MNADQIRAVAEEAYIYAYPILLGYGFSYPANIDPAGPNHIGMNRLHHFKNLGNPKFINVVPWINTDTPYGSALVDLRAEPYVIQIPEMPDWRFQDVQFTDFYTHNFAIRGTRTDGNAARTYLLAGPDWDGQIPPGIDDVMRCETRIAKVITRILLESPDDWGAIDEIETRYRFMPLSTWLGIAPPPSAPAIDWLKPDTRLFEARSADFIRCLNFLLQFCPAVPSERDLLARFAAIGIGAGQPFDAGALPGDRRDAIDQGVAAAHARIMARVRSIGVPVNGWVYPLDIRGGRDILAGSPDAYLRRAAAANYAIWGPTAEEVVYAAVETDADGAVLDGTDGDYILHFDRPPPVRGFWSFTVYNAATRCLAPHPSGKFAVRQRDPSVRYGADGSLTIRIRHEAPDDGEEGNWLPAPRMPFQVVARLFLPEPPLLDGRWTPPPIRKTVSVQPGDTA
jgi:hypothetical protein